MAYPYRSILVPIAFDDPTLVALGLAKQMATEQRATLHLLHVAEKLPAFGESDVSEDQHSPGEEKSHTMLQELSRELLTGTNHEIHTASASARALPKAVVQVATEVDADVIVMKTTARTGLSRFILGNVAEEVVRTAPCPVVTLSPQAQEKVAHLKLRGGVSTARVQG